MKPSGIVREGDDYLVSWDAIGVGLEFTRVRETEAAIRALVTPVALAEGRRPRLLAPIWSSLYEVAGRERLAKAIRERIVGPDSPDLTDWKDSIEHAFGAVIDLQTTAEPLADLAQGEPPPEQGHLVRPLLARNQVNVILADQKSGKSYAALFLAMAVASGRADLLPEPWKALGSGPVIYYDAETDRDSQRRRMERIAAGLGLPRLPTVHYRRLRPPLVNQATLMRRDVAQTGAVLAIVDSLTFAAGGELNTAEVAVPCMNAIADLGDGCTKLVICHHGKAGRKEDGEVSVMGHSAFEFKARNVWIVRRSSEPGEDHIDQGWQHRHANDGRLERAFALRLTFNETNTAARYAPLNMAETPWLAKHGTSQERITAALMDTEFWKADTGALAKATGLSEQSIRRLCRRMPEVREATSGGRGRSNSSVWELYAVEPKSNTAAARNGHSEPPGGPGIKATPYREINVVAFPADAEKQQSNRPEKQHVAFPADIPEDLRELPF